ncbi:MAG: 16S rRNA (uracil(1498)-N(3))-methyltransferase [Actinobacteria bacterium]|nr:16S rRNA (uracil(1498)-N(3))-methyltransferase [Actinomycetota bacterium]
MRSSSAHVFVADLDAPELEADDRHHLSRVLRLRAGETVSASDGRGRWRPCTWTGEDGDGGLVPAGEVARVAAPAPAITVAFAPVKGDRPEWVVQKLTEVGVDRIVVLATARSVVRWEGDRAAKHVERLGRVAREAAMQSRRAWLPQVEGVVAFHEAAGASGGGVALAEPGGAPPSLDRPVVLVGPEGGWSDDELAVELPRVGLGPTVLRAETAAVAAGVLLSALRAGLVGPCPI